MGEKGADWLCGLSERAARLESDAQAGLHDRKNDSTEVPPTAILTFFSTGIPSPVHVILRCMFGGVFPSPYSRISFVSIWAGSNSGSTHLRCHIPEEGLEQ